MIVYWDTSAILQLSAEVYERLRQSGPHCTLSHLTELEIISAMARSESRSRLRHNILAIHRRLKKASLPNELRMLFHSAGSLAAKHHLHAGDSLHLAAALSLARDRFDVVELASYDRRLREAAVAEGMSVFPHALGNGR